MPEQKEPRSWLTSEVRMDPFLLDDARRACSDRGDGADGFLAARRLLDDRLRRMVHWPRAHDYAQLADDLAAEGRDHDAFVLRNVAATDELLVEAQDRWNTRYDTRARTDAEIDADRVTDAGLIDFDPDGPCLGIDGVHYWPGYTTLEAGHQIPVVLLTSRGHRELITGFDDQQAVARWLHNRGPMASGPLFPPDVPRLPRAVLEEHILARMLRNDDLPDAATILPPTTFTADIRYDLYTTITTLARRGQPREPRHVAAELTRRIDWIPDWALPQLGGQGAPWAQTYLRRLTASDPASYAVQRLIADDTVAQLRSERSEGLGQRQGPGDIEDHWRDPELRRSLPSAGKRRSFAAELDPRPPSPWARRQGPSMRS